jgi:hypothetical protein
VGTAGAGLAAAGRARGSGLAAASLHGPRRGWPGRHARAGLAAAGPTATCALDLAGVRASLAARARGLRAAAEREDRPGRSGSSR